jgi:hypothetical protein
MSGLSSVLMILAAGVGTTIGYVFRKLPPPH